MSFRKYCRRMGQHELLDSSILPKANGLKNVFCEKNVEVDTMNCSLMGKPFIE